MEKVYWSLDRRALPLQAGDKTTVEGITRWRKGNTRWPFGTCARCSERDHSVGHGQGIARPVLVMHGEAAEAAFATLVERHGPMVLRVCRGVLGDAHDLNDAFQATFLVLVRRAGVLWVRESLGPWLHGVALRIATKAKAAAARRRMHERQAAEVAAMRSDDQADDLGSTLHEEVDRLPRKYRAPFVLCYLKGLTHERAATALGWPVGTCTAGWPGQATLRSRLVRRGVAPWSLTLVALCSEAERRGRGAAAGRFHASRDHSGV